MSEIYLGYPPPAIREWCERKYPSGPTTTPYVYFGANGNNYKTQVTELTGSVNDDDEQIGIQTDIDSGTIVNNTDITYLSGDAGCTCTSIGDYAFQYCTSLTSVSLPAATSIGSQAFQYCSSLTSVSLPAATSIGNYAFYECTSLTELHLDSMTVEEVQANASDWMLGYYYDNNVTVYCSGGNTITIEPWED